MGSSGGAFKLPNGAPDWGARLGIANMAITGAMGLAGMVHRINKNKEDQWNKEMSIISSARSIKDDHPHLFTDKNIDNTRRYFSMIKTYAPSVAANPLVAGNILNRMHSLGPTVADVNQIKELAEAERAIMNLKEQAGPSLFDQAGQVLSGVNQGLNSTFVNARTKAELTAIKDANKKDKANLKDREKELGKEKATIDKASSHIDDIAKKVYEQKAKNDMVLARIESMRRPVTGRNQLQPPTNMWGTF